MRIDESLKLGIEQLEKAGVGSPRINAEVLLMHAAGCDRTALLTHPERELSAAQSAAYEAWLMERAAGKPAQYITGHQEFWGLEFLVNPSVLIPRPETELLVESAIEFAKTCPPNVAIADVGTGSGCIAVALAKELPQARIFALDNSLDALSTARRNAARILGSGGLDRRITFLHSDLLKPASGEPLPTFDLIISNPPYVSERDFPYVMVEVRKYEPASAVFAGESGIEVYERLIPQAVSALRSGGQIILELGYDVRERVRSLLLPGHWTDTDWRKDLAGHIRAVIARRK
jgi:release factor glutamine methyltransferase